VTSLSTLSERLAALREDKTATPLWVFLYIYTKASRECYISYNHGARVLYSYLTDKGAIPLDYQTGRYPEIDNTEFKVPELMRGYASSELSKILTAHIADFSLRLKAMSRADRAIYITLNQLLKEGTI